MYERGIWLVVLCIFLMFACYFDYRKNKIPNGLLFLLLIFGVINCLLFGGITEAGLFLGSVLVVGACCYPIFKIGALGAGDVKLFGVCAGFFPAECIIWFLFCSLCFAACLGLTHMIRQGNVRERFQYSVQYFIDISISREWKLYAENKAGCTYKVCLAGPVLFSTLLHMGGVY